MLIDEIMPDYDVVERHESIVAAPPAETYEAALTVDLGRSLPVQVLFGLRSIPAYVTGRRKPRASLTLGDLPSAGFVTLGEEANSELVIGAVGRFWRPTSDIRPIEPRDFRDYDVPGMCKAAMNLRVEADDEGTVLSTETRVAATDERARRMFSLYWKAIGPFSGFIRHVMLSAIRRNAEERISGKGDLVTG